MIFKETILKVSDNSGVSWVRCIHIEGNCNKQTANLGERILVSVFRIRLRYKVKEKKYKALIIAVKYSTKRYDGSYIRFFNNKVLLLSNKLKFLGTRVYGSVPKELLLGNKKTLYKKIISYSWLA